MPEISHSHVEFIDGSLTPEESACFMKDIQEKKDFLTVEQYEELVERDRQYSENYISGIEPCPMTKRQYVQCLEMKLFFATGLTRD